MAGPLGGWEGEQRGGHLPAPRRRAGEAAVTDHGLTVASGNLAARGRIHPVGVTSDEAENAPRLRVFYGEGSNEPEPPVKRRVKAHAASAQGRPPPVPWRWRSRPARITGSSRPLDQTAAD